MPHPIVEAFGRPTWREVRAPLEARSLDPSTIDLTAGDGQPVVVAPGFLGSEDSVAELVNWLSSVGYDVRVADLQANLRGSTWAVNRIVAALEGCLRPAILIGHSRGGQQARVATQRRPELVANLVTLGAAFRAHLPRHFALRAVVETMRMANRLGLYVPTDGDDRDYEADLERPYSVDVPFHSIWSRSDGLVAWQSCADPAAVGIEVDCSHRGLVASQAAFTAIATALCERNRSVVDPAGR